VKLLRERPVGGLSTVRKCETAVGGNQKKTKDANKIDWFKANG